MEWKQILIAGEEPMKKTIEKMRSEFAAVRTGRASSALVENVKIESYGSVMPLKQLANITVPEARTIEIRPWDISVIGSIEKGILKSEVGLTPTNDGKLIRLSVPALNEERRRELTKVVHKQAEEFRVSVRNERRQMHENIKKAEKDKQITEDDRKKSELELQRITDLYIKKVDEILALKEKEIMEV